MPDNLTRNDIELLVLVAMLLVLVYSAVALTFGVFVPRGRGTGGNGDGEMGRWARTILREPVRVRAAATIIIGALVTLAASFGVDVDPEVTAAIIGVIAAVAIAVSELSRPVVTPVADPVVAKGTTVRRT